MTPKRLETFIIVAIIALIGIIYAFTYKPAFVPEEPNRNNPQSAVSGEQVAVEENQDPENRQRLVPETSIQYQGIDGQTALEILQTTHKVELKSYDFGDLVVSIDGISPDSQHFWAFYVNGELAQVGAADYVTKSTDLIRWQMEAISN